MINKPLKQLLKLQRDSLIEDKALLEKKIAELNRILEHPIPKTEEEDNKDTVWESRLYSNGRYCLSNGRYYLWKNNLIYMDKEGYIEFETERDGNRICSLLNEQEDNLNYSKRQTGYILDNLLMIRKIVERYNLTKYVTEHTLYDPDLDSLINDSIIRAEGIQHYEHKKGKYVLHINNGIIGWMESQYNDEKSINEAILKLIEKGYTYSGGKTYSEDKIFYTTYEGKPYDPKILFKGNDS